MNTNENFGRSQPGRGFGRISRVELLEERTLLSVSVQANQLTVVGSPADNYIEVADLGYHLQVQVDDDITRIDSKLLDDKTYLERNPDVKAAMDRGAWALSALQHWVAYGYFEGRSFSFDETVYLTQWPDVAAAVTAGWLSSGAEHLARYGWSEGRHISTVFDESFYLATNPDVAQAVVHGAFASGLSHYLAYGRFEYRNFFSPEYAITAITIDGNGGNDTVYNHTAIDAVMTDLDSASPATPDDLALYVPKTLAASVGSTIDVPVMLHSGAHISELFAADLVITYDPSMVQVDSVSLGNVLLTLGTDWDVVWNDTVAGRILITTYSAYPVAGTFDDTLLLVHFTAVAAGSTTINLEASYDRLQTQLNEGQIVLAYQPTTNADDIVDGLLTVR